MMITATRNAHDNTPATVLLMAFELREHPWKLGFSIGHGQKPRERLLLARDQKPVLDEIAYAKVCFALPDPRRW